MSSTTRADRDLEDAAAVIAVITALAAHAAVPQQESPRSVWGTPAHRLGALAPGRHTWWSSGAAR
ncbi:acyl-CoA carboxylase epsilon subunit [Nakamurella sp. A5-74]|uniref:Acyl-CoA carboxylase epsilon subunit n=1 Tax=Nakamurella sp. A5-74 TaxID=3158264 RepID=A0AAU8DL16_9ACTN